MAARRRRLARVAWQTLKYNPQSPPRPDCRSRLDRGEPMTSSRNAVDARAAVAVDDLRSVVDLAVGTLEQVPSTCVGGTPAYSSGTAGRPSSTWLTTSFPMRSSSVPPHPAGLGRADRLASRHRQGSSPLGFTASCPGTEYQVAGCRSAIALVVRIGDRTSHRNDRVPPTAATTSVGPMPTRLPSAPPTRAPSGRMP